MNDRELWTLLEAADPAADVSPDEAETEARFVSLIERRDTMGTTFRHLETPTPTPSPTRRRGVLVGATAFVLVIAAVGATWLVRDPGSEPDVALPTTELTPTTADVDPDSPPIRTVAPTTEALPKLSMELDLAARWRTGAVFEPDPEASVVHTAAIVTNGEQAVVFGAMLRQQLGDSWGAIWTSQDGRTWDRVPHDPALFGLTSGGSTYMRDATFGGPGFVAVGWNERNEPASWASPDGTTWQRSEYIATEDVFLDAVAANESTVVAIGHMGERSEPAIFVSEDGLTWMPAFPAQGMRLTPERRPRVITSGDTFLALVNGLWRSTDGFEWEVVTELMPTDFFEAQIAFGSLGTAAISHGGRAVSLLGAEGEWSPSYVGSGLDWDYDDAPFANDVEAIECVGLIALDEGLIAVGTDYRDWTWEAGGTAAAAYYSVDAATWHRMNLELHGFENSRLSDAARLGDVLIGLGFNVDDGIVNGVTWVLDADAR